MAGAQTGCAFGMRAQHDPGTGIFIPGGLEHLKKPFPPRAHQRRVATRLVDHKDVSGWRRRCIRAKRIIF